MKWLILVLNLMATAAYGFSDSSTKALHYLGKCLPKQDLSCVLAGTCEASFCATCGAIRDADTGSCSEKSYVYAALEGLYGKTEGACKDQCDVGSTVSNLRVRGGAKAGAQVMVAQNISATKALAVVVENGAVSLSEIAYGGPRKAPGYTEILNTDAVSGPITAAVSCLSGNTNKVVGACFKRGKDCSGALATATKCSLCASIASCGNDTEDVLESLFGFKRNFCTGC